MKEGKQEFKQAGTRNSQRAGRVHKNLQKSQSNYPPHKTVESVIQKIDAIKVLYDDASSDQRRKQKKIRENYDYQSKRNRSRENHALQDLDEQRQQAREDYYEEKQRLWEEKQEQLKEANRPLYEEIYNSCNEKKNFIDKNISDLREWLEEQKESAKNEQQYYNRYRSTNYILRKIEERIYQLKAYLSYLDNYRKGLENSFEKRGTVLNAFEKTLPENYPYAGKVYYLKKSDFSEENSEEYGKSYTVVLFEFETTYKISVRLTKDEIPDFENLNDSVEYPFMLIERTVKLDEKTSVRSYLSLKRGEIKDSIGKAAGIRATVISINKSEIKLSYKNCFHNSITLNKEDLIRNKKTPVGSTLKVYVRDYDTLLNKINVTEKFEDSLVLNYFNEVILSMTSEQYLQLQSFINERKYSDSDDEWVFRPKGKKITNLTEIILSNKYYAIRAAFENIDGNKTILVFRELIEDVANLKKDEMFVSARIVLRCYNRSDIARNPHNYEQYFEECLRLRIYLIDDFLTQKNLRQTDSEMGIFVDKWRRLTEKTIADTIYRTGIPVHVISITPFDFERKTTGLLIDKSKNVEDFYENLTERCCVKVNTKENIGVVLKKTNDGFSLSAFANITKGELEECGNEIYLYKKTDVTPLMRQLDELQNFKARRPANERVKDSVLNPEDVVYRDNGKQINFFYNESIQKNKFQEYAVRKAFSAEQFFIIQGPPGTGKTTIIKELVLQYILQNHAPRILIASQTNVAVDNVIKGLDDFIRNNSGFGLRESQIIRCGEVEKMMDGIKKYSFDSKFEDYQNQFKMKVGDNPVVNDLRKEWFELLSNNKESLSVVKSYFINNFNIVGATCVGLANEKYGLDAVDFDLVIIDEAGKALPGEAIIPINRAKKLILIGDHKQLPPYIDPRITDNDNLDSSDIISIEEREYFFKQSFFERIFTNCPEESRAMLKIQFRMPPVVAGLVNKFYDDALVSGESCNDKTPLFLDSHLIFIDMKEESKYHEEKSGASFLPKNLFEPEVVEKIISKIRELYSGRIVVITPYKGQKRLISTKLGNRYGHVVVDTIDAFQGDEEQVVIYCMTRSIRRTKYFSDDARLNVAFSRTKNTLILIGSSKYLEHYDEDKKVRQSFEYIKQNGRCIPYCTLINPNFCFKNKKIQQNWELHQ